jgi:Tol biopolymer transport system component
VASVTGNVRSYRPDGTVAAPLPPTSFWTINDTRVAIDAGGGTASRAEIRDARTGALRATIPNAFRPIVLPRGEVAFWADPNGVRDPRIDSVWVRLADGRIRKLIQLPGNDDTVLSTSFDARGRRLVIANGNDADTFRYDVWLRDRRSSRVRRLTTDHHSRWPALRSDGKVVAYTHERRICADAVRASDIVLLDIATGRRRVLVRGSCQRTYPQPAFLTNGSLVSYRGRRTRGTWVFDLVRISATTGQGRTVPHSRGVSSYSISPRQKLLAFDHVSGGVEIIDRHLATVRVLPNAIGPALAGDLRN